MPEHDCIHLVLHRHSVNIFPLACSQLVIRVAYDEIEKNGLKNYFAQTKVPTPHTTYAIFSRVASLHAGVILNPTCHVALFDLCNEEI